MSEFWRYSDAKLKISQDLDIEDEDFVSASELRGYFNDAIREQEGYIHTMGVEDDYYLTKCAFDSIANEPQYTLPDDIYATKIRGFWFQENATNFYEIGRFRRDQKFAKIMHYESNTQSSRIFKYYLTNGGGGEGRLINLAPTPAISVTNGLVLWYIREAKKMKKDSDIIDVPYISYIFQYVKNMVLTKERMITELDELKLKQEQSNMLKFLDPAVDDDDNLVEGDTSHYEEHQ